MPVEPIEATVEPIPETAEALQEVASSGDGTVATMLWRISRGVESVIPELVGISLSILAENLTFTMTSNNPTAAQLDAVQYLAGGPCDTTLRTTEPHLHLADDPMNEHRWQLFAQATAAAGVKSTLSLPIVGRNRVMISVNLYASTPDAFEGHHEELAAACGAWAGGAVTNADLDFTTRLRAIEAPERLRTDALVDQAIGALVARWGVPPEEADERLHDAARRAGITDLQVAQAVLGLIGH